MHGKEIKGLVLIEGQAAAADRRGNMRANWLKRAVRLLTSFGRPRAPLALVRTVAAEDAEDDAAPLLERHVANEAEAQACARELAAQGYRTQVVQDCYDFSWSVEAYAPASSSAPPRHFSRSAER